MSLDYIKELIKKYGSEDYEFNPDTGIKELDEQLKAELKQANEEGKFYLSALIIEVAQDLRAMKNNDGFFRHFENTPLFTEQQMEEFKKIKQECKRCENTLATKDYNGNGHWVCDKCYDILSDEFDNEYK